MASLRREFNRRPVEPSNDRLEAKHKQRHEEGFPCHPGIIRLTGNIIGKIDMGLMDVLRSIFAAASHWGPYFFA
jgi:hypothetical protein